MSYVEGSLGPMLQGVSQQPDRLRVKGQVSEQINYDSDVAKGLTSRPGTELIATLSGATSGMKFSRTELNGTALIIGWADSALKLWDVDGTPYTTTIVQDASYISTDMVFHPDSSAGHIMVLSRNKITAMSSAAVAGRPFHAAVITCLGGAYYRTYTVTVRVGAASATFSYTTPDGTSASHAGQTTSTYIINQLRMAFNSLTLPGALTGMTASSSGSTLMLSFTDSMSVTVEDGGSNETLRAITDTAVDSTFLPVTAKHGHIVRVQESRSDEDDYYLKFVSDVTTTTGAGFGSAGVWRETATPDEQNSFALDTMPHKITVDTEAKTASFAQLPWSSRAAGDSVTNPVPEFIGKALRDLATFENRLFTVAAGGAYASRTDNFTNLWKKSATVDTDDDPIAIRSTEVQGVQLDWIVPFDRNLLLLADPGKAQFVVDGGGLTPSNASMVLTTQYYVDSGVRPVGTGKTIILPYRTGSFVGVNEFFTNDIVATNGADPLTISQDRYISGSLSVMQAAENFSRLAISTADNPNTVYLYRYLWNGSERIQSAWHKWQFSDTVKFFWFDSSYFYAIMPNYQGGTGSILCRMDMNRVDDAVGYHITLDSRLDRVVAAGNKVQAPYSGAAVIQRTGCDEPGLYSQILGVQSITAGVWEYTLDPDMCPPGATVTIGRPVARTLAPTMPQPRDYRGELVSLAELYLSAFYVHMSDSPAITATFKSPYRADKSLTMAAFPLEDNSLDPDQRGKQDYVLRVPWGERNSRSSLEITCNDARPDTILEIEFSGDQRRVRRRLV